MTSRAAFKRALKNMDKRTRLCLLYLERTIDEKFKLALDVKTPPIPKVDFSKIESEIDSLQKQINGLRTKVEYSYRFTQEYDNAEIFLKRLVKEADEVLSQVTKLFEDLYESGFYKEGIKRKIRESGLIKNE